MRAFFRSCCPDIDKSSLEMDIIISFTLSFNLTPLNVIQHKKPKFISRSFLTLELNNTFFITVSSAPELKKVLVYLVGLTSDFSLSNALKKLETGYFSVNKTVG